jgi:hypothetical protein
MVRPMKHWYDLSNNPESIEGLYGGRPELDNLSVIGIVFDRNKLRLTVVVEFQEFPSNPPARWPERKVNVVQAEIDLFETSELEILGLSANNQGKCTAMAESDRFRFQIIGDHFRVSALCEVFMIQRFNVHQNEVGDG